MLKLSALEHRSSFTIVTMQTHVSDANGEQNPAAADDVKLALPEDSSWREAITTLRGMFGNGPSLEDEFMRDRRSEKW
jgi:hypothetical protein